jgi:hypothetical protein
LIWKNFTIRVEQTRKENFDHDTKIERPVFHFIYFVLVARIRVKTVGYEYLKARRVTAFDEVDKYKGVKPDRLTTMLVFILAGEEHLKIFFKTFNLERQLFCIIALISLKKMEGSDWFN